MTTQSHQQTLQQRRAGHAFKKVEGATKTKSAKEYGSLVRGLPAMIQTDGIGATLAFLKAKGKEQHLSAYGHLDDWLGQDDQFGFKADLLEWLLTQPTPVYRQVANEAIAYLLWLKRFAEAKGLEASS